MGTAKIFLESKLQIIRDKQVFIFIKYTILANASYAIGWGLNAQGVGKLAILDRKRRFCRKRFKIMSMVTMVTEKTIGKLGTTEGRNSLPLASNFGSIYFLIIVSITVISL